MDDAEQNPQSFGAIDADGVYLWKRNDTLGLVEFTDGTTREYTDNEKVYANVRVAKAKLVTLRQSVKELIGDVNTIIDKAQVTIDTPNSTINASPAAYIKDNARAIKRALGTIKDIVRLL